jgi:hypothetical protein
VFARSGVDLGRLDRSFGCAHCSPLDLRRIAAWDGTQDEETRLARRGARVVSSLTS